MEKPIPKIYISGQITGLNESEAKDLFQTAENKLQTEHPHLKPVNPMKLHNGHPKTWEQYMITDIEHLMQCEFIYMLRNWGLSRGARIEYAIARELGLVVMFENHK